MVNDKNTPEPKPSMASEFGHNVGRTVSAGLGKLVGWLILGLIIGAGLFFLFDYFVARPATYICDRTGLCSPPEVEVPAGIYIPPVERIQALSQLTTTRFNYSHTVTGQVDMPAFLARLYGESLIMVAVGHIDAGIDVSTITEDSIVYDTTANILSLTLPAPALQDCFLDEGKTYIVERRSAVFAQPSPDIDTETRRYALRQFQEMALEDGILDTAREETAAAMTDLIGAISGAEVQVNFLPGDPDAPLPETCG